MIIDKNWFYKLSEILDESIYIKDNIIVCLYDDWIKSRKIFLWEWVIVDFCWLLEKQEDYNIQFFQEGDNSILKLKYLLFSNNWLKLKTKIHSKISSNNSICDIKIISIVWEKWDIILDWILEIDKWYRKIKWDLIEENLFLWNTWKIKWLPALLVWSNDVEARHACKIEKISDEKMFYLRSRGIWEANALNLIIESYVKSIFSCLSMIDNEFYNKLIIYALKRISS